MNQVKDNKPSGRDYSRYLKSRGLKVTEPRLKILAAFDTSTVRHLSAEDIYRLFQKNQTNIGLATIYRVLTQFEQADMLVRHHFENDKAVFELNDTDLHDHLVCIHCGRVVEFLDPDIKKRQSTIAEQNGFKISAQSIYLYAQCINCPDIK